MQVVEYQGEPFPIHPMGVVKLLEEVIFQTFHPTRPTTENTQQQCLDNIRFAQENKLLHHFCDIYEYDHTKIKDAIIKINLKEFNILTH